MTRLFRTCSDSNIHTMLLLYRLVVYIISSTSSKVLTFKSMQDYCTTAGNRRTEINCESMRYEYIDIPRMFITV